MRLRRRFDGDPVGQRSRRAVNASCVVAWLLLSGAALAAQLGPWFDNVIGAAIVLGTVGGGLIWLAWWGWGMFADWRESVRQPERVDVPRAWRAIGRGRGDNDG